MMYGFLSTFPDGSTPEERLRVESDESDSMKKR